MRLGSMNEHDMNRNTHLHLILVILLGTTLFLFQSKTNGFIASHHGNLSSHGMALARNLSLVRHPLFMFTHRSLLDDGRIAYAGYNRFPILPFLVIRLGTCAFEPSLAEQIYVARLIMDLFYLLAMIIGFLIINDLLGNEPQALVATVLTFGSFYLLYYSDMIFNDIPALLGFTLALLLVVRNQRRRMRTLWLMLASFFAVTMGWQPLAVFLTWLLVDLAGVVWHKTFKLLPFLRRPSCVATLSAVVLGAFIIVFQLLNEQHVTGLPLQETDTFRSALWRFGLGSSQSYAQYSGVLSWTSFSVNQLFRIASMIVPFAGLVTGVVRLKYAVAAGLVLIAITVAVCGRTSDRRRSLFEFVKTHRQLILVLILSGLFWSLPMRHFVVFHDFQTIFYIGIPIAFFTCLCSICGKASKVGTVIVVGLFVLCVYVVNLHKAADAPRLNELTGEFQSIGDHLPANARVFFAVNDSTLALGYCSFDYYTAGVLRTGSDSADFVVSLNPNGPGTRLTNNPHVNLFSVAQR
jgi:hypothetical protein